MKYLVFLLILIISLTPIVQAGSPPQTPLAVELDFETLAQGNLGMLRITGEDILRVRAAFLDHQYIFQPNEEDIYEGFVAVPMDAPPGSYRLSLLVMYADGSQTYIPREIRITRGFFGNEAFTLPIAASELLDQEIILDEFAILDAQINRLSEWGDWAESGLAKPFDNQVSDTFGSYRLFNGVLWQRHTGIDYPKPIGTPISVAASGKVVLAQSLWIRGNYVLVDHGWGLFTGYAHLSESYVKPGEWVEQGEVIGAVGSTGRSVGSHLHWEVTLGGVWIDPIVFANRLLE